MLAVLAIALVLVMGAVRLGVALVGRARAETAADAAALAAADFLALGRGTDAAIAAARQTASRNGARLVACACGGGAADVVVEVDLPDFPWPDLPLVVDSARGRARAEVRPDCATVRGPCS